MIEGFSNVLERTETVEKYTIQPAVDADEARQLLSKKNGWFSSKQELLKVELLELPVYIFSIESENRKRELVSHELCVDAVEGQFAFIQTEGLRKKYLNYINESEYSLNIKKAGEIARKEFRYHMFRFRPGVTIGNVILKSKAVYPYWIGYYKSSRGFYYEVVDACNGKKQGIKMRPLFNQIILEKRKDGPAEPGAEMIHDELSEGRV